MKPYPNCLKCFRLHENGKSCTALKEFQYECWAFADNEEEFEKRDAERTEYLRKMAG